MPATLQLPLADITDILEKLFKNKQINPKNLFIMATTNTHKPVGEASYIDISSKGIITKVKNDKNNYTFDKLGLIILQNDNKDIVLDLATLETDPITKKLKYVAFYRLGSLNNFII